MKADTEKIFRLIHTEKQQTIANETGITQPYISRIVNGKSPIEGLTIRFGAMLTTYAEFLYEGEEAYQLIQVIDEKRYKVLGIFKDAKEIKAHLIEHDYFKHMTEMGKKKPNFDDDESIYDLKEELSRADVDFYRIYIQKMKWEA